MSSQRFFGGLTLGLGFGYLWFSYDHQAALERLEKKHIDVISTSDNVNASEVVSLMEQVKQKNSERLRLREAWKTKMIQESKSNPGYEVRRNKALKLNEYLSLSVKNELIIIESKMGWLKDNMQQGNNNEAERDLMVDSSSNDI
ncbi:hypothetical protein ACHQM5_007569 [Ranunculus cassubicifolius]